MPPSYTPKGLGPGFFNRIKDRVRRELGGVPTQGLEDSPGGGRDEQMSSGLWSKILDRAKTLMQKQRSPSPSQSIWSTDFFNDFGDASPNKNLPVNERLDEPSIRARIAEAGRLGTLLLLKYNGVFRHVEPYSFRTRSLKPKKKGGVAKRAVYFYGYCRLHDTIEAYRMERIEGIYVTDEPYTPRWAVEVA